MKILIVFNKYQYRGGEDTYVNNLTRLLTEKGHTVRLFIKDSRTIDSVLSKIDTSIKMFWNRNVEREMSKILDDFCPDVAHFHNIYPLISPVSYHLCKKRGIRIVQTIHNYKFMCPKNDLYRDGQRCQLCVNKMELLYPSICYGCYHGSRLASFLYVLSFYFHKLLGRFSMIDTFIFPSQFTLQYYSKNTHLDRVKFVYLPYHVYPEKLTVKKNGRYILYVGRLTEEKGILALVREFQKHSLPPLYIIGDGPLKEEIKLLLNNKPSNIIYLGRQTHSRTIEYISKSKFVVVPSQWYEVLPNVILEALKLKKCVFVSQHNPNLKKLSTLSNKLHTYSNLKDLVSQLSSPHPPHKSSSDDQLMKLCHPDFHYKKIISIYSNEKV